MRLFGLALLLPSLAFALLLSACHGGQCPPQHPGGLKSPPLPAHAPQLGRDDFNRLAIQANLPLYWMQDKNGNGRLEASELAARGSGATMGAWVSEGALTPAFQQAYARLVQLRRREAVRRELDQGRPTLIESDFRQLPTAEKRMLAELLAAAKLIDQLYQRQTGAWRLREQIAQASPAAKALVARNAGPWCSAPATGKDPFCNALPTFPKRRSETYPDVEQNKAFCDELQRHPDTAKLFDPFTVVRRRAGKLVAVPLTEAFAEPMKAVSKRLRAAAAALDAVPAEKALRSYLLAAAKAFETNDWQPADEAWVATNSQNSKWFLRVAPDEVYVDPCQQKAGFHLALARIDPGSLAWKRKLMPLRDEMEQRLAKLIGKPYEARKVKFDMPDFVQVVLNAGDSRHPLGATIGQSLPNWGKVATEGRRRTMQMSNLYTDPDSLRIKELKARALLAPATLAYFTKSPAPQQLDTILHEVGHNFGPDSGFRINGKMPKEIFSGALASTLEELKAQTLSLWYHELLLKKGVLDDKKLREGYVDAVMWAFGHISRGMESGSGQPAPYSRLAAVQMGWLRDASALTYADGKFTLHFEKIAPAIERLMQEVGRIKARGDAKAGQALIDRYISKEALAKLQYDRLRKVLLAYPKAAFDYAIRF